MSLLLPILGQLTPRELDFGHGCCLSPRCTKNEASKDKIQLLAHPMLQTPLCQIEDDDTMEVIADLCQILKWPIMDFKDHPLFAFLQIAMTQESDSLSTSYLPTPSILDKKLAKIQSHGFYPVCKELKNGLPLEPYDSKTLMTFLKNHFTDHRPKSLQRPSEPTEQERDASLVNLRRRNGSL